MKRNGLLKNMTELAAALGRPFVFVKRMRWAGFPMPGGVSTVAWALDWLRKHPEFRQKDFLRPPPKAPHQAPHLNGAHPVEQVADRSHEQCH
jgi:hypothetical protein